MQNDKPRLLEAEFTGIGEVKGYKFKRIKSNKLVYLYQVDGRHYEVFRRLVNSYYNTETYPSSKQFGRAAWTYATEEAALKKFKEVTKKYSK